MNRMDTHYPRFHNVTAGNYSIGISKEIIERISPSLPQSIKPEYLYHSYPLHSVNVGQFEISSGYVTVAEFSQFIDETGYTTQSQIDGWAWTWEDGWKKKEDLSWEKPFGHKLLDKLYCHNAESICVLQVSFYDAVAYCNYLSQKIKKTVVLPNEYMWEAFAYTIGVADISGYIDTGYTHHTNYLLHDYCEHLISICKQTHVDPGNIWEWTSSYFMGYPGGIVHKEYGTTYTVLRGGSYFSHSIQRTRQYRFRRCPTARSPFYTFRICIV
ncbi:MAG: formylglycine-generating enzyme family protein [Spirochaetota bacterium]